MTPSLIYGDTGVGKSTLAATLARHIFATTGKKTRVYVQDPPTMAEGSLFGALHSHGVVEFVDMTMKQKGWNIMEVIQLAAKGWVPVNNVWHPPTDNDKFGLWVFEGATAFGEWILEDLREKRANGMNYGGPESSIKPFSITDDNKDTTKRVAGNQLTDYSISQDQICKAVDMSGKLPSHVLWTALETSASEKEGEKAIKKRIMHGPMVAGSAKATVLPKKFAHTFSIQLMPTGKDGKRVRRVHLQPWFDSDNPGIPHIAIVRALPTAKLPPYFEGFGSKPDLGEIYEAIKLASEEEV